MFLVRVPMLGTPLGIMPLPLLGRPMPPTLLPRPPCGQSVPAYPSGALSLLARLDFFGTVRLEIAGPEPGDDTEDIKDIESPDPMTFMPLTLTLMPTLLSSSLGRFVLPRPDGGGSPVPSSNRSMDIDPGEDGKGVDDELSLW